MNNQTETQNCDFTSDLKLKGFKVYQINGDVSKIPTFTAVGIFIKSVSIPVKVSYNTLTAG